MQRRHFEAIAEAIRSTRRDMTRNMTEAEDRAYSEALDDLTSHMIGAIRRFNPQFDASRFREACALDTTYRNKSDGRRSA